MRNLQTSLLALVAMALTVAALWLTNRTVIPRQATWEDVVAEGKSGNYRIITTDQLYELYQQEADTLLLVDTRQEWEFRTGHLQGAVNFPMEPTAWARWREAGALENFLGPDKDRHLVFY